MNTTIEKRFFNKFKHKMTDKRNSTYYSQTENYKWYKLKTLGLGNDYPVKF